MTATQLLLSAAIGAIGALGTMLLFLQASGKEKADIYLSLRDRYLDIRRKIPNRLFRKDYTLNVGDEYRFLIEQYWYAAFDEWFTTTQLNRGRHRDLWDTSFADAIRLTLRFPAFVEVLENMVEGHVSFGEYRDRSAKMISNMNERLPPGERAKSLLGGEPVVLSRSVNQALVDSRRLPIR